MSTPKIIGQLVIVAYKAKHLPEREIVGKQDPFVLFRIGEAVERTKTDLRGGQHPVWDDQVTLPIPEKKTKVVVQVYDEDGKRQELISECELNISNVLVEGEEDNWYELQYKGRPAGEIYLEMTFYAARPPPKRTPTRFGMNKHLKQGGYVPPVPPSGAIQHQARPYHASSPYPPPPGSVRPMESHSTPAFHGTGPYPPQQQRPPYGAPQPYPPVNPTPSISAGSQHTYHQPYPPVNNGRPNSYSGPSPPQNNNRPASYSGPSPVNPSRPTSPPIPGAGGYGDSASGNLHAPLLSSSYSPQHNSTSARPNYGGYPPHHGGYPPQQMNVPGNRNSFPIYNSPYPPSQQFGGFPEPQQFSGGYAPHADTLGTPFAAHQGTYPPSNNTNPNGYPPQLNNGNYPPQQGFPPSGYPPY